ncbi:MAG TPA: hypothetical protein VH170_02160 [Chthoniobacterales bacterium]|jgi:hypothetical protein|nr:hypothetical protein [Chthoniobacterales bacterium]
MNNAVSLAAAASVLCATIVSAVAADNRFDGIWVGTETVMGQEMHGTLKSDPIAQSRPAKIVIAQGGALLGVLEGYGTGRYSDVKRVGETIVFHAASGPGNLRCRQTAEH